MWHSSQQCFGGNRLGSSLVSLHYPIGNVKRQVNGIVSCCLGEYWFMPPVSSGRDLSVQYWINAGLWKGLTHSWCLYCNWPFQYSLWIFPHSHFILALEWDFKADLQLTVPSFSAGSEHTGWIPSRQHLVFSEHIQVLLGLAGTQSSQRLEWAWSTPSRLNSCSEDVMSSSKMLCYRCWYKTLPVLILELPILAPSLTHFLSVHVFLQKLKSNCFID